MSKSAKPLILLAYVAAGCFAITIGAAPSSGNDFHAPMEFSVQIDSAGNQQVFATGEIVGDSGLRLKAVLDQNHVKAGSIVILHSPGGLLDIGMEMGRLMRARSLDTRVGQLPRSRSRDVVNGTEPFTSDPGECDSACTFAFLGGVRRTVPPSSKYGIHDAFVEDNKLSGSDAFNTGQATFGEMAAYAEAMGIDPEFMLFVSRYDSSKGEVFFVPEDYLQKWRVTTADLKTKWELDIRDGDFQLIGSNPNSSQFAGEHDEIALACHGQPKHVEMLATYVTPSRSVFTATLSSQAFATSVEMLKLAIARKQEASGPSTGPGDASPATMVVEPGDVLEKTHPIQTHSVQARLSVSPAMISFLQSAQEINMQFYTSPRDYYGFVMTLPTKRTQIADFAAACK
jgi:hypothetical protein